MKYALPSGVVNTDSAYYYADSTLALGPLVKELNDQTLVVVDYSLISSYVVSGYEFALDVTSNPALVVSYPQLNPQGKVLTFLLSGGVTGQQYRLLVQTVADINSRVDVLTINIPSSSGDCVMINPVPEIYTQLPLGDPTQGYVNTGTRYFWGAAPPNAPNVMDQWYDPTTQILSEYVTDGVTFFWQTLMDTGFITDAPSDNTIYGRYNGVWVKEPIQADAPAGSTMYVRQNKNWAAMPPFLLDAPVDGSYYSRLNGTWHVSPGGMTDAPSDNTSYVRHNAGWVRPIHSDITDWDATLAPYALIVNVPVAATTVPRMDGVGVAGTGTTWARADHVHPTDTSRLALAGGTMAGALTLVGNPVGNLDAATKQYVDVADAKLLPLAGGTMTGVLTLVGNPAGNLDAAPKQYVDVAAANASIDCGTY
jgi:hypothetical protein